jgi:hypothetical protein
MYQFALPREMDRAMTAPAEEAVRQAVFRALERHNTGKPAADVVQEIVKANRVNPDLVRKALRILLERGDVVVGPTLNLIIKTRHRASTG